MHGRIVRIDDAPRDFFRIVYAHEDKVWKESSFRGGNYVEENNLAISDSISKKENDNKVYFYKFKDGKYTLRCIYEIW
jgi:hypothetical protein